RTAVRQDYDRAIASRCSTSSSELLKNGEWPHSMVMTLHGVIFTITRCSLMRTALSSVHSMYQRGTEPKRSSVSVTGVVEMEIGCGHSRSMPRYRSSGETST